jgi:ABC-type dipeptide/oligopeptide/nickel transport system permease subunit
VRKPRAAGGSPRFPHFIFARHRSATNNAESHFPGLFILVTVIGFNLFGDALREVLDPRIH